MAKKPEAPAKDEKGLTLEDIIRLGKTKELNFVAGIAKGGVAGIVADLRKGGTALFNIAKEKHDGLSKAKSVMGTLTINGKNLNLKVQDEEIPGALKKQLKKMLKEAGMPMKVVFQLPGGGTDEDDDDEDEEGGGDGGNPMGKIGDAMGKIAEGAGKIGEAVGKAGGGIGEGIGDAMGKIAEGAAKMAGGAGGSDGAEAKPGADKLGEEILAEWGEKEFVLESLVETGPEEIRGQGAKLLKMMRDVVAAKEWKKAKGVLKVITAYIDNAMKDVGDVDADRGDDDEDAGGSGGGSSGGTAPSGGGGTAPSGGGGTAPSGGGGTAPSGGGGTAPSGGGGTAPSGGGGTPPSGGGSGAAPSGGGGTAPSGGGGTPPSGGGGTAPSGGGGTAPSGGGGTAPSGGGGTAPSGGGGTPPSGGGSGAAPGTGGGGSKGGETPEEAEARFKAQAQQIAQKAQASAAAAAEIGTQAETLSGQTRQSSQSAEAIAQEAVVAVGPERAKEVTDAAKVAEKANEQNMIFRGAVLADANRAKDAAAQAQGAAQGTRDASGVAATQAAADLAEKFRGVAEGQLAKMTPVDQSAKEALDKATAAKTAAVDAAEKEKTEALAKSKAVIDRMKGRAASAAGGGPALDTLVADLKADLVEQQAIVEAATPNRGTIGEAQRTELEAQEDEGQTILQQGTEAVTAAAKKLAEDAKTKADEKENQCRQATTEAEQTTQEANTVKAGFDEAIRMGGSFIRRALDAKNKALDAAIDELGKHNAKAAESLHEIRDGVTALVSSVSRAVTGFIDRVSSGRVDSASSALDGILAAFGEVRAGARQAVTDFKQATDAAMQAAQAEKATLIGEAEELAKPWLDKAERAGSATGQAAKDLLREAQEAKGKAEGMFDRLVEKATSFGGKLFDEAAEFATGQKNAAGSAMDKVISLIEATRRTIEQAATAKMNEIKGRAEGKIDAIKAEVEKAADTLGKPLQAEVDYQALFDEIGKFAEDKVKPGIDELKDLRTGATQDVEAVKAMFGKVADAIEGLATRVATMVEDIIPDFGDDPVAPKEKEVEDKGKSITDLLRTIEAKERDTISSFDEARKAADEWLKGIMDDVKAKVDEAAKLAQAAEGDGSGLENGVLAQLEEAVNALGAGGGGGGGGSAGMNPGDVGGKIGQQAQNAVTDGNKAVAEHKKKVEAAIKKIREELRDELGAYNQLAMKSMKIGDEILKMRDESDKKAAAVSADFKAKYGSWVSPSFIETWQKSGEALVAIDKSIDTWNAAAQDVRKEMDAAAAALAADDNATDLRKARDAISKGTAVREAENAKMPGLKTALQASIDMLTPALAQAASDFKDLEADYVRSSKDALKWAEDTLQQAKGDDKAALQNLLKQGPAYVGRIANNVNTLDNYGGSECMRVRRVIALDRDRISVILTEAEGMSAAANSDNG